MKMSVVSIVYLLGALQASLLVVGINLKEPFRTDRRKILTGLLLAIIVVMIYYTVVITEYIPLYAYTDSLGTAAWMAVFPLYYLLHRSLLETSWKLSWKHLALFPVTLLFLVEGVVTTLGVEIWVYGLLGPQLFLDLWMAYLFGTGVIFTGLSIRLVGKQTLTPFSRELRAFSYAFMAVLLVFGGIFLFIRTTYEYTFEYVLVALFEVLVFAFIFRVFRLTSLQSFFNGTKYVNTTRSKRNHDALAKKLEEIVETEKPYLDQQLNLTGLASLTEIGSNELSQLLNEHYGGGFYGFVNKYRLRYAEALLLSPESARYSISGVAEESGFRSKATFYKVFKEKHGLTPTEFVRSKREV